MAQHIQIYKVWITKNVHKKTSWYVVLITLWIHEAENMNCKVKLPEGNLLFWNEVIIILNDSI